MGEGILRFDSSMDGKPITIPESLRPLQEEGFLKACFSVDDIRKMIKSNGNLLVPLFSNETSP